MKLEQTHTAYADGISNVQGDWTFIEGKLPEGIKLFHVDSYYVKGERLFRFQGIIYREYGNISYVLDTPPIELLHLAYIVKCEPRISELTSKPYIVWTLWIIKP